MTDPTPVLEPCPFDDGSRLHGARVRDNGRDGCGPADTWWMQCKCGAEGPNARTPEEATLLWNRRSVRGEVVENGSSPAVAEVGALLTGAELMDEMDAYVASRGGNPAVAKAIRDAFEGRGRDPNDKGKLIHAVRNDLKVEAVTMYRRVEPRRISKAEGADSRNSSASNERPEGRSNLPNADAKDASPDARNKALEEALREIAGGLNIEGLDSTVLANGNWHSAYFYLQRHARRALKSPEPTR